ncbi:MULTISPECIES: hypothetical protein [unclassified Streptomyces]|uniref:hypothetical protein n=1 Tax=unclassified Streptomyces TaxID=2593676 RepID=UPI0013704A68|nr:MULTISPECIES: hypothetical protein [unclassified Streptomyces]NEA03992.1 hypothetical protein [Streptomyces sp. SID10116]MYY85071.1 hypothetical protein [Streptomyces sp. SID335]MYZ17266.1 hypothetical protein [Streptomyces sp. SID337]NDZ87062.1 hypothetical protein [Streptomyces sp. SID10115]NEB47073.1 hypothetical protein [Streptomyces sp. SID339]
MAPQPRPHHLLLGVCGAFAVLSLVLVPLTLPLGWDETVYASRFSPYAPATPFSAPRTRGVPFLIAPVAAWSDSVVLLRVWLTLLATTALYAGFRPWLRFLGRPSAAAVAAALYGGLWFVLFYAGAAMPNHYTAMGAVGAVGLFLRSRQSPVACAGVVGGLALATLMRPNDGVALGAPLLAATLLVPDWRSWSRVLAVLGGLAAGVLPWIVEAYVRFGGVRARLTEASEVQGELRPLLSVVHHFTVMDGPLLCRPCDGDTVRPLSAEWWLVLPLLVTVGLWSARAGSGGTRGGGRRTRAASPDTRSGGRRTRSSGDRGTPHTARDARREHQGGPPQSGTTTLRGCLLATVAALSVALPYLALVPYAAPRFLAPAHALLAPVAALGVLALVDAVRASRRPRIGFAALGLALAGHLAVQLPLAHGNAKIQAGARGDWARVAEVLHEHGAGGKPSTHETPRNGAPPPCVLRGNTSVIPVAYVAGCFPGRAGDARRPTALVMREAEPPPWARSWPRHRVPDTYAPGWVVHVRP